MLRKNNFSTFVFLVLILISIEFLWSQPETNNLCKSHPSGQPPAMTGAEAWKIIHPAALRWQKDAQVFEFRGGSFGPDGSATEGKGTYWYAEFYSPSDASSIMVSVNNATISCTPGRSRAPKLMLSLDESVNLDTTQIYKIAIKAGGKKYQKDCAFGMSLEEESGEDFPELKGTHWLVSCNGSDGRVALFVQINSRTGKIMNITKN